APRYAPRLTLRHGAFSQLRHVCAQWDDAALAGVIFDLGVSSPQLDQPERGFSFRADGPLDMRMDPALPESAADLVNTREEDALADLFFQLGEERHSRRAARAIVQRRRIRPLERTTDLAAVVAAALPRGDGRIHPATRVFQALRIAVNRELEELTLGLDAAMALLEPGGRIAVISFHSLEDRIVKQAFAKAAAPAMDTLPPVRHINGQWVPVIPPSPRFRLVTRKPLYPDVQEITHNPRARSARLRLLERCASPTAEESSP
ncbi:MAG: 16S rRNA (cytosine(1402)-N(4))-methyltransferase RsmH, partial [Magnetococcus sp. WYHC-3]